VPAKKAAKKPKKAARKTRTEAEYQELRKAAVALARCVNLTLQTRGQVGKGSGMLFDSETKTVEHWSTQFFDAMEMIGITYDRDQFFEKKRKR
jgi:hypothetical protein